MQFFFNEKKSRNLMCIFVVLFALYIFYTIRLDIYVFFTFFYIETR